MKGSLEHLCGIGEQIGGCCTYHCLGNSAQTKATTSNLATTTSHSCITPCTTLCTRVVLLACRLRFTAVISSPHPCRQHFLLDITAGLATPLPALSQHTTNIPTLVHTPTQLPNAQQHSQTATTKTLLMPHPAGSKLTLMMLHRPPLPTCPQPAASLAQPAPLLS